MTKVVPACSQTSSHECSVKVKELYDAGLIRAEQNRRLRERKANMGWQRLSDAAKNQIYERKAAAANAYLQAQLRAVLLPLPTSGPLGLGQKAEEIRRDLEKAVEEIKLF